MHGRVFDARGDAEDESDVSVVRGANEHADFCELFEDQRGERETVRRV